MVRKAADADLWGVKFYTSMDPEWIAPAADEAHRLGLNVLGHVPATTSNGAGYNYSFCILGLPRFPSPNFTAYSFSRLRMNALSPVGNPVFRHF